MSTEVSLTDKPGATPTTNDMVVGIQIDTTTGQGAVKLFPIPQLPSSATAGVDNTYVDAGDAATLAAANAHADAGDTATLASANSHADTGDSATLSSANSHADAGDVSTLASAKSYADSGDATTLASAKAYADSLSAGSGGVAQSYVDSHDASTLSSANAHADSGDTTTLNSAKAYADSLAGTGSGGIPAYTPNIGTSPSSRSINVVLTERMVSVKDYGAVGNGTTDDTAAFNNAFRSGAQLILVPKGNYKLTNLVIDKNIWIMGEGRTDSIVNITTTTTHGVRIIGDSATGRNNCIRMQSIQFNYTGAGQPTTANWSGMYIQRKVILDEVYVNGFTNDGIYFAPSDADEATANKGTNGNAVFFAELRNVWTKNNGRDGLVIRYGANANLFSNVDASRNKRYGINHMTDGAATYGNTIIGGQASYNAYEGYRLETGTNLTVFGIYAELNGCTNPDNVGVGGTQYTNTPFDFYIGSNLSRSLVCLGVVYQNDNTKIRAPTIGLNDSIAVMVGGDRIFGAATTFAGTAYHTPHKVSTATANCTATDVAGVVSYINSTLLPMLRSSGVTP